MGHLLLLRARYFGRRLIGKLCRVAHDWSFGNEKTRVFFSGVNYNARCERERWVKIIARTGVHELLKLHLCNVFIWILMEYCYLQLARSANHNCQFYYACCKEKCERTGIVFKLGKWGLSHRTEMCKHCLFNSLPVKFLWLNI